MLSEEKKSKCEEDYTHKLLPDLSMSHFVSHGLPGRGSPPSALIVAVTTFQFPEHFSECRKSVAPGTYYISMYHLVVVESHMCRIYT